VGSRTCRLELLTALAVTDAGVLCDMHIAVAVLHQPARLRPLQSKGPVLAIPLCSAALRHSTEPLHYAHWQMHILLQ
jgi:hypothetical protein